MAGASPLNIESVLRSAVKTERGVWKDIPLPLAAWTLNTGVVLAAVGAGIVGNATAVAAAPSNLACIQWDDTADASDIIRTSIVLPPDFRAQISAKAPNLILYVRARVLDGTGSATANTDLALQAQCFWHKTGDTALSTLAAVVANTIGATDYVAADEEGFVLYKFDLTAAMSAAQLALLGPLDTFQIQLFPQEAVGTNLYIEMIGSFLVYEGHASIPASVLSTLSLT